MGAEELSDEAQNRVSRRRMLKRIGTGAAVAWTAPVLTSIRTPAFAQGSPGPEPCEERCQYIAHIGPPPSFGCLPCDEDICPGAFFCAGPEVCAGPACARITSVTYVPPNTLRVCTDCRLDTGANGACTRCPDPRDCNCPGYGLDPADSRCALIIDAFPSCPNREWEFVFVCASCP
jgi:hypothetical protein